MAVLRELAAKGFRPVQAGAADLWLDVVVLAPGQGRGDEARGGPGGPQGGGHGRGRGGAEGGRGLGGGPAPEPEARERTVIVKLVAREGERTLWTAAVDIPAHKPGDGLPVLAEDWMRRLLEPLPTISRTPPSN